MSLPLVLILLAYGIALSQTASNARAVTLHWLRLGDLVALSLLGIAGVAVLVDAPAQGAWALYIVGPILTAGAFLHLMLVQSGHRTAQRAAIALVCAAVLLAFVLPYLIGSLQWMQALPVQAPSTQAQPQGWPRLLIGPALVLTGWLTGGSLMTMLLGHAYLTSGSEMTQQPFIRLVQLLFFGLLARLAIALSGGLWPWWTARSGVGAEHTGDMIATLMISARFLMGLLVPLVMTWMALQCVRIRSNQSATGILYVSSTMILVGEFIGLSMAAAHGLPF